MEDLLQVKNGVGPDGDLLLMGFAYPLVMDLFDLVGQCIVEDRFKKTLVR